MRRFATQYLKTWREKPGHKPLIIRGARQVGKTHSVRKLGQEFTHYIEINFEQTPAIKELFQKNLTTERIIRDLSLFTNQPIIPGKTLVFLDEIQAEPQAIVALRYFFEQIPELHIIAAGSLLDFALEEIGIPVGRVEFMYMHPMSFIEFLWANEQTLVVEELLNFKITTPFPEIIHQKLLDYLGEYLAIGGMPEAIKSWIEHKNIHFCSQIHQQLIDAYRQDFLKYSKKFQIKYIDLLFDRIPYLLGQRFKYNNISDEYRKRELEPCLKLLTQAGVIQCIFHTAAQGLPLGAQLDLTKFKTIFLDIALAQTMLDLKMQNWMLQTKYMFINKGEITEAFVGQEILAYETAFSSNKLFYWQRESRSSNAEVDYISVIDGQIIPIEVKSNKGTSLKSMQVFLADHPQTPYGIRFSSHQASVHNNIHSYPLYAVAAALQKIV